MWDTLSCDALETVLLLDTPVHIAALFVTLLLTCRGWHDTLLQDAHRLDALWKQFLIKRFPCLRTQTAHPTYATYFQELYIAYATRDAPRSGTSTFPPLEKYVVVLDFFLHNEHVATWDGHLKPREDACEFTEWLDWMVDEGRVNQIFDDLGSTYFRTKELPHLFDLSESTYGIAALRCTLTVMQMTDAGRVSNIQHLAATFIDEANDKHIDRPQAPLAPPGTQSVPQAPLAPPGTQSVPQAPLAPPGTQSVPHESSAAVDAFYGIVPTSRALLVYDDVDLGQRSFSFAVRLQLDFKRPSMSFVDFDFADMDGEEFLHPTQLAELLNLEMTRTLCVPPTVPDAAAERMWHGV